MNDATLFVILLAVLVFVLILIAGTAMIVRYESIILKQKKILDDSKERQKLIDYIPESGDTIYITINASDNTPKYISENIENILGIKKEVADADLYSLRNIIPFEDVSSFSEEFGKWNKSGELEKDFEFINAQTGDNRVGKLRLRYDSGENIYALQIRDITFEASERKRLEKELTGIKNMNSYRNEFISGLSHSVRTPINSILGNFQLIKACQDDPRLINRYIDKAAEQTNFLLSLLNVMFDISQIETGGIELELKRFDIMAVADKLRNMFVESSTKNNVSVKVNTEGFNVRYLMGDVLRLQQILISFVTRALEVSQKCTEVSVDIRQMNTATDKVNIMFRIKDNGKTLTIDELNNIFTPFEKERSGNFALALSDQLIKTMGGRVIADSGNNENSFTIFLTFAVSDEYQDMEAAIENETDINKDFTYDGCRILLAEDNEMNAEIAKELLEMQGAYVDIAQNGIEAVNKFRDVDSNYDVILMDIQMPEMDGWEATRRIRDIGTNQAKTIPIFALSANVFTEDKRHSIEAGMNGHLTKPINFEELRGELAKYL